MLNKKSNDGIRIGSISISNILAAIQFALFVEKTAGQMPHAGVG